MPTSLDQFAAELFAFADPRCEKLLDRLFSQDIWQDGPISERRVLWTDAAKHRKSDWFKKRGIYIWGIANRPLYVGKTEGTFAKRFNRYVWLKNSQCALATRIKPDHEELPADVAALLKKNRKLGPRIDGSRRFAREGISEIWFALFPVADAHQIDAIEAVLIAAVGGWNRRQGIAPLLNIHGGSRTAA